MAVRMELAPQIAGLTQDVFNAFLQQQQQAIQAFQANKSRCSPPFKVRAKVSVRRS